MKYFRCMVVFWLLGLSAANGQLPADYQEPAMLGVADLREINFDTDNAVSLNGDWEFYWNYFYPPHVSPQKPPATAYVPVPALWQKYMTGKHPDQLGFASYRLLVLLPDTTPRQLALYTREMLTAYRLFINGQEMASNGQVSKQAANFIPQFRPKLIHFAVPADTLEIIIHVANYSHQRGGIYDPILLGASKQLIHFRHKKLHADSIILGTLLVFILLSLAAIIWSQRKYPFVWLSLLAVMLFFRQILLSEYLFPIVMPQISWAQYYRLDYLSFISASPVLLLFYRSMYPAEVKRPFLWLVSGFSLVFGLLVILQPPLVFSRYGDYYRVFLVLSMLFLLYCLWVAYQKKRNGSLILFTGSLLFFITVSLDIIASKGWFYQSDLFATGFLILLLSFFLFQTRKANQASKHNILLKEELAREKNTKEKELSRRMEKLDQLNKAILTKNKDLEARNAAMQKQQKELSFQRQRIQEQNNMITTSLQYAQNLQLALLPGNQFFAPFFSFFRIYQPKDIVSGDFYWAHQSRYTDSVFIAVIDCTGHGVPGAFMTLIVNQLLEESIMIEGEEEPRDILTQLDQGIQRILQQGKSLENSLNIGLCRLNFFEDGTARLNFSGARMKLIYWKRREGDELQLLEGVRRSVGFLAARRNPLKYEQHQLILDPGDSFYLYSDGIIDQNNAARKRFGSGRFFNVLNTHKHEPMAKQKAALIHELMQFQKSEPQRDDITVLGFQLKAFE